MIVISRPNIDLGMTFLSGGQRPEEEADSLYFYPRGRDALLAALRAFRVMPGDAIILPAYICESTIEPLRHKGYQIVFVDIETDLQLDPAKVLETAERCGAKAVLAVHYFGFPSDVVGLSNFLRPRGIKIIEDCCHSFLTQSNGQRIGFNGDAAIFSMRKTLPIPDGGALRFNVQDFNRASLGTLSEATPAVGRYVVSRLAEALAVAVGQPNIYSPILDKFKMRLRGEGRKANVRSPAVEQEPRRQVPSKLLASYLFNEDYLQQISNRTVENYAQLVAGALALGLHPYLPQLTSGCVPQWAPLDDPSGQIVPWMREKGVGACRWPWHELPAEVAALPSFYPNSNNLNSRLALIPVHQSIGPRQMARMLQLLGKASEWLSKTSNLKTVK